METPAPPSQNAPVGIEGDMTSVAAHVCDGAAISAQGRRVDDESAMHAQWLRRSFAMSCGAKAERSGYRSPKAKSARENSTDPANEVRLLNATGRRGEVRFFLQRVSGGLYVEREETPRRGLRTTQSVLFADALGFNRWCDNEPVRFEHPLLFVSLKRDGDDLWRIGDKASGE